MVDVFRNPRPPLIIEQVEDALLAHLKAGVSGQCKVEAFPDDPAKYDFAMLPAALLIHYAGSQYQSAKGPANKSQARRMSFALVLLCRSLRGEGGAYGHLEDVRLAVQGATFAGAGPAEITRDALEDERDGVWRWTITIAMPIPAVARDMPKPSALMRPMISPLKKGKAMAKQSNDKKSYRYDGPVTSFDVTVEKTRTLFPGRSYSDLPVEHPIIANLIERKLLVSETTAAEPVASEGA